MLPNSLAVEALKVGTLPIVSAKAFTASRAFCPSPNKAPIPNAADDICDDKTAESTAVVPNSCLSSFALRTKSTIFLTANPKATPAKVIGFRNMSEKSFNLFFKLSIWSKKGRFAPKVSVIF